MTSSFVVAMTQNPSGIDYLHSRYVIHCIIIVLNVSYNEIDEASVLNVIFKKPAFTVCWS